MNPNPHRSLLKILGAMVTLGWTFSNHAAVEIFTDSAHPLANLDEFQRRIGQPVTVYDLDAPKAFARQVLEAGGLPANPEQAKALALQRLAAYPGFREAIVAKSEGHRKAAEAGIDRIPAIVFDGQQVIYGVTDLADAWSRYRRWAGSRP